LARFDELEAIALLILGIINKLSWGIKSLQRLEVLRCESALPLIQNGDSLKKRG
jgi:hypothetical protein